MTKKRFWRTLWAIGLFLSLGLMAEQAEACVVTYTDYWVINGEVAADGFIEDYFDSGSCYDDAYSQWYYWEHSYDAYVSVQGPLCGDEDSDSMYSIPYGGGSGYAYVSVPSTICDLGIYTITISVTIYCTIGGNFAGEYEQAQVPMVDLEVNESLCPTTVTVTRGDLITATLDAGEETITNQQWTFNGGGGSASKSGGNGWGGEMASSGTIVVTFDVGEVEDEEKSCIIEVNPRTAGWASTPPNHTRNTSPSWQLPWNPNPPGVIGQADPEIVWDQQVFYRRIDGGPNDEFLFFDQPLQLTSSTRFWWDIYPEFANPSGAWYHNLTCNNYDPTTNPTGFIRVSDLQNGVEDHEYRSTSQSHYAFFTTSFGQNNPGTIFEGVVGESTIGSPISESAFLNEATTALNNSTNTIYNDTAVQPYDAYADPMNPGFEGYYHLNSSGMYLNTCP